MRLCVSESSCDHLYVCVREQLSDEAVVRESGQNDGCGARQRGEVSLYERI